MTATTAPTTCPEVAPAAPGPETASAGASRTATVVASTLWVFVAGLLGYGVVQTAIQAVALFR